MTSISKVKGRNLVLAGGNETSVPKKSKDKRGAWGGGRKTVNSHSSLHCCGCSCILSCSMIIWSRQDIQIRIWGRNNMECFNIFGLIFVAVIMIPNILFAMKWKDGFQNKWNNKSVEMIEQIGRFGCLGFMILNIPGTWFGWWSDEAFAIYLLVDTVLAILYCTVWVIFFQKNRMFTAMALSIIPSILFLFSGIMSRSILLILSAVLFAPSHIMISYKNAK